VLVVASLILLVAALASPAFVAAGKPAKIPR